MLNEVVGESEDYGLNPISYKMTKHENRYKPQRTTEQSEDESEEQSEDHISKPIHDRKTMMAQNNLVVKEIIQTQS